jgi:hypothetical protein
MAKHEIRCKWHIEGQITIEGFNFDLCMYDDGKANAWFIVRRIGFYNNELIADNCRTSGDAISEAWLYVCELKRGTVYDIFGREAI